MLCYPANGFLPTTWRFLKNVLEMAEEFIFNIHMFLKTIPMNFVESGDVIGDTSLYGVSMEESCILLSLIEPAVSRLLSP